MSANAKKTLLALIACVALMLGASASSAAPRLGEIPEGSHGSLKGGGMWIWYVSDSERGNVAKLAAKAKANGIKTLFIKGADGGNTWSQLSAKLIDAFHAKGIKVCTWQYVYGSRPKPEADAAIRAISRGADCFIIDAETEYEGRYREAAVYVRRLRAAVGKDYPIGLSTFPYVDYHPSFPYSVFLGPGGAQYNLPQIYWHTIGDPVDESFEHTFIYNRVYGAPIRPLGQVYNNPKVKDVSRFRRLTASHGMGGVSWWSWQSASAGSWKALTPSQSTPLPGYKPPGQFPVIKRKGKNDSGDLVVWAQMHLVGGGFLSDQKIDGRYDPLEANAVRALQTAKGLPVTGVIDRATWKKLLAYTPYRLTFTSNSSAVRSRYGVVAVPESASLPALGYEIPARGRG
jgi:hypothetical protein